ncbi:MAG: hypothetical protein O3A46_08405 [Candidatus Poribacteria bacterium]|nr:hypothetical protein [Candidatus Poribacteria bacterium]
MRCAFCGKTWTCQPEGMKHGYARSQRVRALERLLDETLEGGEEVASRIYRHRRDACAPGEGETATPECSLKQLAWRFRRRGSRR